MDYKEPLFWIHLNMDYPFNLKGILYFPKINMEYESIEGTIKLYKDVYKRQAQYSGSGFDPAQYFRYHFQKGRGNGSSEGPGRKEICHLGCTY